MVKKINIIYWIIIAIIAILSLNSVGYVAVNWYIATPIIILGCTISIISTVLKDEYTKHTLALTKTSRNPVYDYIRTLAVILVIFVHTISWDLSLATDLAGTGLYTSLDRLRWWSLMCNMLFILISGALLLPYKEEKILTFYKKRVIRIVVPLVVYFIWYLWQYDMLKDMSIWDVIVRICTADTNRSHVPHFWLIYRMLFVYMFVPFLRTALKNISYKRLTLISIIIIGVLTIIVFIGKGEDTFINTIAWILVAALGYWESRRETRRLDIPLIVIGIVATIYMFSMDEASVYYEALMGNLSILRIFTCLGFFSFFISIGNRLKNFYFIKIISKYSYGIMLIHMWALYFVTREIISISAVMYHGAGLIISSLVTLLISLIASYLIDNIIVTSFMTIGERMIYKK